MPRKRYQDQLRQLRGEVAALGDMVLDRYELALDVLETGDSMTATRVIDGDESINEWFLDIEDQCTELITLQQPVAGDLRMITASFKILTDLERVGDLATNLARYGHEASGELATSVNLTPIAEVAGKMVADAMDAYAKDDADRARAVATRDNKLDRQCTTASEAIARRLLEDYEHTIDVDALLDQISRALLTVRDLERVGDHAVNICSRTVYMVENDDELIY
ncbi:phosphate signaling complex protein PhoU [Halovenus rubra]|uniref:Phosphate-specific transport system accessory protein PhoU n=2 Tax=Halovenus rubra TaxID=869890 RepID=A0ABD5X5K8_9EURY|nr:phosphate signaling complex protein PhoU [Halovenus rubra]